MRDGLLSVRRGADADGVRYFLEVLDVADVLYRSRIRLRKIRSRIVEQMDERAERFAYDCLLLNMDLLLRSMPESFSSEQAINADRI